MVETLSNIGSAAAKIGSAASKASSSFESIARGSNALSRALGPTAPLSPSIPRSETTVSKAALSLTKPMSGLSRLTRPSTEAIKSIKPEVKGPFKYTPLNFKSMSKDSLPEKSFNKLHTPFTVDKVINLLEPAPTRSPNIPNVKTAEQPFKQPLSLPAREISTDIKQAVRAIIALEKANVPRVEAKRMVSRMLLTSLETKGLTAALPKLLPQTKEVGFKPKTRLTDLKFKEPEKRENKSTPLYFVKDDNAEQKRLELTEKAISEIETTKIKAKEALSLSGKEITDKLPKEPQPEEVQSGILKTLGKIRSLFNRPDGSYTKFVKKIMGMEAMMPWQARKQIEEIKKDTQPVKISLMSNNHVSSKEVAQVLNNKKIEEDDEIKSEESQALQTVNMLLDKELNLPVFIKKPSSPLTESIGLDKVEQDDRS